MTTAAGSRLSEAMSKRVELVIEHLRYEYEMLEYSFERLTEPGLDRNYNNAMTESFCIHARNLIDFFWGDRPLSGDTPSATHFTVKDYAKLRGDDPRNRTIYGKLNTEIAHLSYSRAMDKARKISHHDRMALKTLIEPEIANFYANLREPYRQLVIGGEDGSQARLRPDQSSMPRPMDDCR